MSVYSPFIPTFADMCFADALGKNHKICWLLKNHKSELLEYFKKVTSTANTKQNGEQRPYTCKHNESKFSSAYCRNIASTKSARGIVTSDVSWKSGISVNASWQRHSTNIDTEYVMLWWQLCAVWWNNRQLSNLLPLIAMLWQAETNGIIL